MKRKGLAKFGLILITIGIVLFSSFFIIPYTLSSPDSGQSFPTTYQDNDGNDFLSEVQANDGSTPTTITGVDCEVENSFAPCLTGGTLCYNDDGCVGAVSDVCNDTADCPTLPNASLASSDCYETYYAPSCADCLLPNGYGYCKFEIPCSATGKCNYNCNAGYYDCDGVKNNGCESDGPCGYAYQTENDANWMNVSFGNVIPSGVVVDSVDITIEHWESDADVDLYAKFNCNGTWYTIGSSITPCEPAEANICNFTHDLYAEGVDTEEEVNALQIRWEIQQGGGGGDIGYVDYFLLNYSYTPPYIEVNLTNPDPGIYNESSPKSIIQYSTFTVNTTVACKGANCGEVYGTVRYNSSGSTMTPINITEGATPFYIVGASYQEMDITYAWNESDGTDITASVNESDNVYAREYNSSGQWCSTPNLRFNFTTSETYENVAIEWKASVNDPGSDVVYLKCWNGTGWHPLTSTGSTSDVNSSASISACDNSDGNYTFKAFGVDVSDGSVFIYVDYIWLNKIVVPASCGSLSQDQTCQLNWTINGTSLGSYKIDVNFSSSLVTENDTDDAVIKIVTAYKPSGTLVSTTQSETWYINQVTPTWSSYEPASTSITIYVSANGGTNWEEVTNGTKHTFLNSGKEFKYKAVFQTSDALITPILYDVNFQYSSASDETVTIKTKTNRNVYVGFFDITLTGSETTYKDKFQKSYTLP